jgi:hypothetical protein
VDNNAKLALNATMGEMLGMGIIDKTPDLFGIEIELEGRNIKTFEPGILKHWVNHVDNSLRSFRPGSDSTEYVLRQPLSRAATVIACTDLMNWLTRTPGTEVFPSYRTSIHVHVNCLQETLRTVCNFITLCLIFDELLVSQNGETRIGNNFCLRAKDAEGQIESLKESISRSGGLNYISGSHRYSSINFASLLKFGSVEFRSLECTTDLQRLVRWIDVCQQLKVHARSYENPREIISVFSRRGPFGFSVQALGGSAPQYLNVPNSQRMVQEGMRLAQDFAYCSEWKLRAPGPKRKPPKTDKLPHLGIHQEPILHTAWDNAGAVAQAVANAVLVENPVQALGPQFWDDGGAEPPQPDFIDDDFDLMDEGEDEDEDEDMLDED